MGYEKKSTRPHNPMHWRWNGTGYSSTGFGLDFGDSRYFGSSRIYFNKLLMEARYENLCDKSSKMAWENFRESL